MDAGSTPTQVEKRVEESTSGREQTPEERATELEQRASDLSDRAAIYLSEAEAIRREAKLLPMACPFCNSTGATHNVAEGYQRITCECGAYGPMSYKDSSMKSRRRQALALWNERAGGCC